MGISPAPTTPRLVLDASIMQSVPTSIVPSVDATYNLGSTSNRWKTIYLTTGKGGNDAGIYYNDYGATIISAPTGLDRLEFYRETDGKWGIYDRTTAGWLWAVKQDGITLVQEVRSNLGTNPYASLTSGGNIELHPKTADSTNTLVSSPAVYFYGAYWDGTQSVVRYWSIQHKMVDTTGSTRLVFFLDGVEKVRFTDAGDVYAMAGFMSNEGIAVGGGAHDTNPSIRIYGRTTDAGIVTGAVQLFYRSDLKEFRILPESGGSVGIYGHLNPVGNNTYDLGNTSNRWAHLYVYYIDIKEDLGQSIKLNSATQTFHIENLNGKFRIVRTGVDYPFVIDGVNGYIGIWTTTPTEKLDVNGTIKAGSVIPQTDATYNLGSVTNRWFAGYFSKVFWGTGAVLSSDQGGSIELGDSTSTGVMPYIDFHYGVGSTQDFNVRIQNVADGELKIAFASGSRVLTIDGNVRPQSHQTYDLGSSTLQWRYAYINNAKVNLFEQADDVAVLHSLQAKAVPFLNANLLAFKDVVVVEKWDYVNSQWVDVTNDGTSWNKLTIMQPRQGIGLYNYGWTDTSTGIHYVKMRFTFAIGANWQVPGRYLVLLVQHMPYVKYIKVEHADDQAFTTNVQVLLEWSSSGGVYAFDSAIVGKLSSDAWRAYVRVTVEFYDDADKWDMVLREVMLLGPPYWGGSGIIETYVPISWDLNKTLITKGAVRPNTDASYDLGTTSYRWRNAYISNSVSFADGSVAISKTSTATSLTITTTYGSIRIGAENTSYIHFVGDGKPFYFSSDIDINGNFKPYTDNSWLLGTSTKRWKGLYLSGPITFGDGSTLSSVAAVDASASVANTETTLYTLSTQGVYGGWILLPAVNATWTIRLYVNSETTPWDEITVTTTSTSGLNERLVRIDRVVVDGSIVTQITITVVSNSTTANTVTARILQMI